MFRLFSQYGPKKTWGFLIGDLIAMTIALVLGVRLRYLDDPEQYAYYTEMPDFFYRVAVVIACLLISGYYNELYTTLIDRSLSDQFFRLTQSLGVSCFVLASIYFLFPSLQMGRLAFAIGLLLIMALVMAERWAIERVWHTAVPKSNVLILGDTELGREIAREISFRSDLTIRVSGFIARDAAGGAGAEPSRQLLGSVEDIEEIIAKYGIVSIIVALDERRGELPVQELLRLRTRGVHVEDGRSTLSALTGRISVETVRSSWFVFSEGFRRTRYTMAMKRTADLILSTTGLVLSAPAMAVTALIVRLDSPGPILYRQIRTGLNGRPFELLKFRTMRADAEADGVARWATENDPRITRMGGFLRKYRFDELPQFLNVIRGEMSFVGPRPERPEFVEQLAAQIPYYEERHTMRPGITGWAQVCYPYGSTVEDALRKLEYDLFYLKSVSMLFDVAIVLQTVKIVLWGRGR